MIGRLGRSAAADWPPEAKSVPAALETALKIALETALKVALETALCWAGAQVQQ